MGNAVIFFITFFSFYITFSESCTRHPQEHFCTAGIVVQAAVLEIDYRSQMEVINTVRISRDLKNSQPVPRTQCIHTRGSDASCGTFFELNQDYIFTGNVLNSGSWFTTSCNFSPQVQYLSPFHRAALYLGIYRNNCDCKVTDCTFPGLDCPSVVLEIECVIRSESNAGCLYENNTCGRVGYRCNWILNVCFESRRY
ncbi:metalloproteinase inhibitor 4-like [Saccostrea cucullata]|uniref:metalloproteinase inhibitor 4-like n=1 Tax=Saccostrea cuccullata TaxID=36930 RepID=UPI002ED09574